MGCSNLMLHGVSHDCTTNVAGVSKIYFTYRDNITPVVDYNTNTMTSYSLVGKWYEYSFAKNSASLSSTLGFTDNGIPFYTHTINMSLNGLSAEKNLEVMALADNELVALIVDANGKAWYVGVDGYINSSSSEFATGADVNNRYGYALTIDGSSEFLPFEYLGALPDDPSFDPRPYLTFNVTGAGNIHNGLHTFGAAAEYRINFGEWVNDLEQIPVVAGDIVQFRAQVVNPFYAFLDCSAEFFLTGYLSSIINGWGDFENLDEYTQSAAFSALFANCTGLTDASQLKLIKKVGASGYRDMFRDCINLRQAPALPATNLSGSANCYRDMFAGCSSLVAAPELPATTLAANCYQGMFGRCTSMTKAPTVLPATILPDECYFGMFEGCSNLTIAPEMYATEFGQGCCMFMFNFCSNIITGPTTLGNSNTTMADSSCKGMFEYCSSLTTAPELPATNLSGAANCYEQMFMGCSSLLNAPELPATTLAQECYMYMFHSCSRLTDANNYSLPATTLAEGCYKQMYSFCSNLTDAPILPATTLVNDCYNGMFLECYVLNFIKCNATDISATGCTDYWVSSVAASGSFVAHPSTPWTTGDNGIPSGWTRVDNDERGQ